MPGNNSASRFSFYTETTRPHLATFSALERNDASSPGKAAAVVEPRKLRLIVAGGGTGGHLFPGIAIAEEALTRHPENSVRFIGTGNPFETAILASKGFDQERIHVAGIKGQGVFRQLSAMLKIPGSIQQSVSVLKKYRPDLVLGLGGYSSGPVVIGAWLLGIPRVLHEQNVLPGITNRLLAGFANRIYVSFENTRFKRFRKKLKVTGNPVRKEFLKSITPSTQDKRTAADRSTFTILVVGGSQGAHGINIAVTDALPLLEKTGRYEFIHQTGESDEEWVKNAYAHHRITATARAFFDDMATQYQKADMVICRAGATTIAELTIMGKGVIFIPYPYAADDHQALNAAGLVSQHAAEMIREKDLNGRILAEKIQSYAASPHKLNAMALNAKHLGRPWAAEMIVDDMVALISQR